MVKHLGVSPYGFGNVMSERVHLKVLYFYILWHLTLTMELGATKGAVRRVGVHPSSQLFIIMFPWVSLVKTHLFDLLP